MFDPAEVVFHNVAPLIRLSIEGGRSTALGAFAFAGGLLITTFRDDGLDATMAQIVPIAAGGVSLIASSTSVNSAPS